MEGRKEIAQERRILTDEEVVIITNSYLGADVYEVRVISEEGIVIEEYGEMSRRRAWNTYHEVCEDYECRRDLNSVPADLEEGLPEEVRDYFTY